MAFAQQVAILDGDGQEVHYLLEPLPGQSADAMFAPQGGTAVFTVDGRTLRTRDGQTFEVVDDAAVGIAGLADPPSIFNPAGDDVSVEVGFCFLKPHWSNEDFRNLLPGDAAILFPDTNLSTDVDHEFAFAPIGEITYRPAGFDAGFQTSGYFITLEGKIEQTGGSQAAAGSLTAHSDLTIAVANFLEIAWSRTFVDLFENKFHCADCAAHSIWADTVIEWSMGGRYSSLKQNFNATLRQADAVSITSAEQNFSGVGVTASLAVGQPLTPRLVIFGRTRGSFLVGDNDKASSYSLNIASAPSAAVARSLSESRTEVVPVGEFECGLVWNNRDVVNVPANRVPQGLLWVKAGFVSQVWGDSSLLSAGTGTEFRGGDLYLYGFTIQVGLER